jgi:hypothetical protein
MNSCQCRAKGIMLNKNQGAVINQGGTSMTQSIHRIQQGGFQINRSNQAAHLSAKGLNMLAKQ